MQQIDDLILEKFLGKGSFGEVYLSTKKGHRQYYATKKIERKIVDKPSLKKYFDNEINILNHLNHPNIVKLVDIKRSVQHYYIVMEYVNGGGLSDCLKKYMDKHKSAFSEEIVQHLMRQIIDALHYIHKKKIIHRDLKLDNIMVNFDTEKDKENLNMMKAKIKIIDFGFATKLSADKNDLTYSAVGSPINMDPIILAKFAKKKDMSTINQGYDEKADIWSIGTVCYELLIGKAVFDAQSMGDLVDKVENGSYTLPKTVSKEIVSFLNGMLQYDAKFRLSSEELLKHPFLTKNVADFTRMDAVRASKINKANIKKNKSIWAIFNNEEKFTNIEGGKNLSMAPIAEEENFKNETQYNIDRKTGRNKSNPKQYNDNLHKMKTNNINNNPNIQNYNNFNYKNRNSDKLRRIQTFNNYPTTSFYGQNMNPGSQQFGIPQMGMPNMSMNYQPRPMVQYPSFGVGMPFNAYGGYYNNRPNTAQVNPSGNNTKKNTNKNINYKNMYQGTEYENDCGIY
jgi:serine/threonine protein kinase